MQELDYFSLQVLQVIEQKEKVKGKEDQSEDALLVQIFQCFHAL